MGGAGDAVDEKPISYGVGVDDLEIGLAADVGDAGDGDRGF